MLLEVARLLLVTALLVALPGYLLVNALFPARHALRPLERAYLVASSGTLLLITVGVVLGLLPHGDEGHFRTLLTGAPNLELAVLAASLVLLWIGLHRGAYPRLAARFPKLLAMAPGAAKAPRRGEE